MSDRCRSCDAPIIWARTANNRLMPLVKDEAGEFAIQRHEGGLVSLLRLSLLADDDPRRVGERYRSHLADCPHSAVHRRTR
jgi:hypothetical protein